MKKGLFFISAALIMLASCSAMHTTSSQIKKIRLGMTKEQVVGLMGKAYTIELVSQTPEGDVEILGYGLYSNYETSGPPEYLVRFLNGKLVEYHRYVPPAQPEVRVIREESK